MVMIRMMNRFQFLAMALLAGFTPQLLAQYPGWQHSGSISILTTPDGADLPASASVKDFPVLVRLHEDYFDFGQAMAQGEDLRFSADGKALAYQVEEWDAAQGTASIWVRIPLIKGNALQELKLHWGKADAPSESNGAAVFNESNGYVSVWHLGDTVKDEVGTLASEDKGTTTTPGMIGSARHFPGQKGVFCGDKIPNYPSGDSAHTTALWFRAERPNSTVIGWGNEGGGRGSKIRMQFRSPPHIHIDSDFSDIKAAGRLPVNEWVHVVHTYGNGPRKIYINGKLDGEATTKLDIKSPGRLWLGGWYHNYDFVGDIDEVRISKVARSADWVRLQYENQKPLQTLVGLVEQAGELSSVSRSELTVAEGASARISALAGGAIKIYWSLIRDGQESVVATDRLDFEFQAGRVVGDSTATLRFKAIYPGGSGTHDIAITVRETIPEPVFNLKAPATWDGRTTIGVVPQIANLSAMQASGAGDLQWQWDIAGLAVIKEVAPGKLILTRAQNSGEMSVTATVSNGGKPTRQSVMIKVTEPESDAWVERLPGKDEKPEDNQFYARDDQGQGTLYCNGALDRAADSVFLKLYADDQLVETLAQEPAAENAYAFTAKLKAGLIRYRVELGVQTGGNETILHRAGNIVCGDAYIIEGQSNALATDTHEKSPAETNDWIRSYARPRFYREGESQNLWSNPVWKAQKEHTAELGWWGMELAKNLVKSQQVPIFIINGAAGGTRIDQHQRDPQNPEDLSTIYGRLLWRVRQAKLTHGIRAVLWHQGENDQGAAGPDGGYGWQTYQQYFVEMSAAWKQDFPNLRRYYVYQIWPNSCSMGNGNGDRLREVQRSLPSLYSNMDVLSTLGIDPPGTCHFPLVGWSEFARLVQPLIERDFYGGKVTGPITAPNLKQAYFTGEARDEITLDFDQPVIWFADLVGEFYLDGEKGKVESGSAEGDRVTLKLKEASAAKSITYLHEMSWSQKRLLIGENGIAALTFCEVPIRAGD